MNACARRARLGGAAAFASTLVALAPFSALSGAWTEPQGQGLLIETLWGWTGDGAPWGGDPAIKQNRADLQAYAEYGLNDRWTIFGQMAIERYALSQPTSSLYAGLDYSDLGLRAKLWSSGAWVFSGEATLFLPGAWNPSSPSQAGNTGGAAEARALAGMSFELGPAPGFFDLELAYRARTAGPPGEGHLDATIGLKPAPGVILMLQDFCVVSMPSTDPAFTAWRENVMQASLVLPVGDRWSLQVGYFWSNWAVKTNTERGWALAAWRTF